MTDKNTISISGKQVFCFRNTYNLGELFIGFLELDLSEYEAQRLEIKRILDTDNQEVMTEFIKIENPRRGYQPFAYEILKISDKLPLREKYVLYAIYKALITVDHIYFEVLDYSELVKKKCQDILDICDLVSLQAEYKKAMEHCLLTGKTKQTALQRLKAYEHNITGKAELVFDIADDIMYEAFIASDISSLLYIEFMKMIQNNIRVSVCENCRKLFIPKGNYDMKYCDRKTNDGSKSCQEIGAIKRFKDKVKKDPVYNEYEKAYKRFYSRKRKGLITQNQFNDWVKRSSKMKKEASQGFLTLEDFKKQISEI